MYVYIYIAEAWGARQPGALASGLAARGSAGWAASRGAGDKTNVIVLIVVYILHYVLVYWIELNYCLLY